MTRVLDYVSVAHSEAVETNHLLRLLRALASLPDGTLMMGADVRATARLSSPGFYHAVYRLLAAQNVRGVLHPNQEGIKPFSPEITGASRSPRSLRRVELTAPSDHPEKPRPVRSPRT